LIRFTGSEAATFLQGQLTQDVQQAGDGRTLLAACNTSQGRVVAVLRLRQTEAGIWALVASDLADAVAAHLRRYVLRAKVRLAVDADAVIAGSVFPSRSLAAGASQADPGDAIVFQWTRDRQVIVRPSPLPAADAKAVVGSSHNVIGSGSAEGTGGTDDARREGHDAAWSAWLAADIADGLPHVSAGTTGHFVAQMLNLDLLDAISFNKGCYTGQEIIARTQNLGRVKRRMLRYRVDSGPSPPMLAALERDATKVGEVLQAARGPNGVEFLAVVNLDARDRTLRLADGREAVPLPLPYVV
jgi:folate-binding protein YgfZ